MNKKWIAGLGAILLTLGIGTAVYAADGTPSFGDMLPFMQKMHPQLSEGELNQMYQNCHQGNGMQQSGTMMQSGYRFDDTSNL
ncbi:hypothetical protein [Paenibacillus vini]|uniref:FAD/FMN-containing dehydrogenase n=1 Tax=Paenibacillus vini TaxID=1476024 RepID=A0ABQ4M914_9BACL|nr:hypothetical protein [Paenibacillus vini]GIP52470.1 hypothetical protein J42TS3_15050 [Paenibacillus vini]